MTLDTRHSTLGTFLAYVELARPANVVTAWADILAGAAASGLLAEFFLNGTVGAIHESPLHTDVLSPLQSSLPWLLLATTGLYAGGVVLNDVFDATLDATERPERAIPSGRVSQNGAALFGVFLILLGVWAAFQANSVSGWIAAGIGLLAVVYDRYGKHHALLGPLNMGLCRSGNLLLGVSAVPAMLSEVWLLGIIPVVYISAITAISQGEVHGGSKTTGHVAVLFVFSIVGGLFALVFLPSYNLLQSVCFIVLFSWVVLPSFLRAARLPEPVHIRRAVKAGIIGLIPLNAALAAGFAGWPVGVILLLLLPISLVFARLFAVT